MNASRDHKKVQLRMNLILRRLSQIKAEQGQIIEKLRKDMKAHVNDAVKRLSEYLKSPDVRARFTSWTLDEVPKAEHSWEVTKSNITKALRARLKEIVDQWEEDNQVFTNARESLAQRYTFKSGTTLLKGNSEISKELPQLRTMICQKVILQQNHCLQQVKRLSSESLVQSGFHLA